MINTEITLRSVIEDTQRSFFSYQAQKHVDTYLYLNCVEHVTRMMYMLMLAINCRALSNPWPTTLKASVGLGGMLEELRRLSVHVRKECENVVVNSIADAVSLWVDNCYREHSQTGSIRSSRNIHSHGSVPSVKSFEYTKKGVSDCLRQLADGLSLVMLMPVIEGEHVDRMELVLCSKGGLVPNLELYPFWIFKGGDAYCVGSIEFSTGKVAYTNANPDFRLELHTMKQILKFYPGGQAIVDLLRFKEEVEQDIRPFAEPRHPIEAREEGGIVTVHWCRLLSDQSQSRIDQFCIKSDVGRAWRPSDSDAWKSYVEFLKFVVVWELLSKRIEGILEDVINKRYEREFESVNDHEVVGLRDHYVEPKIEFSDTLLNTMRELGGGQKIEQKELIGRIDSSATTQSSSTTVYFLHADAGAGKTELMLRMAHARAKDVALKPAGSQPLYLFISSTGSILADLDTIVEATLNATRLLNAEGAKVLCRNGLLVLMVDGFDELVSQGKFEDTLDSLTPWLRGLKSKGAIVASARSSWYLMQYREQINKERDLSLEHRLLTLSPWSEKDVGDYLYHFGWPATVGKAEYEILKIPFFSKAFVAARGANSRVRGVSRSAVGEVAVRMEFEQVFMIVVDFFLSREERKLTSPVSNTAVLNADDIKRIFSEVAGFMHGSPASVIELEELATCAEAALGVNSLNEIAVGLRHRLSSLCGVQVVNTYGDKLTRFEFSHEVLYACFLTTHILTWTHSEEQVVTIFSRKSLPKQLFGWLFALNSVAAIKMLQRLMRVLRIRCESVGSLKEFDVFSSNVGSLWSTHVAFSGGVPIDVMLKFATVNSATLVAKPAGRKWSHLRIERCIFSELDVSDVVGVRIELVNSSIDCLTCRSGEQLSEIIADIRDCRIGSIRTESEFIEPERKILGWLGANGIISIHSEAPSGDAVLDAEYYLEKLIRGGVQIYVFDGSRETDSDHLRWTKYPSPERWSGFLKCLEDSNLIEFVPFNAAGSPKSRVKFLRPLSDIAAKNFQDPEIRTFWKLLEIAG